MATKVVFRHPTSLIDTKLLHALGGASVETIVAATLQGKDGTGEPMRPLTSRYANRVHGGDRTRRLRLTRQMLSSSVVRIQHPAVEITWTDFKAAIHNRDVGWIGLSQAGRKTVSLKVSIRWTPPWAKTLKTKTIVF